MSGSVLDPLLKRDKPTRTDMDCTNCGKKFFALLDYTIRGNHVVNCPHCNHEHCRVIVDGRVTEERWSSRENTTVKCVRVWKSHDQSIVSSTVSAFIRDRWLNFGED